MKTIREIRESVELEESNVSSISNIPFVIILKRKAIRIYPNGQKVALYHNEKLDKYVTIPFSDIGVSEEVEQIDELMGKGKLPEYIKDRKKEMRKIQNRNYKQRKDDPEAGRRNWKEYEAARYKMHRAQRLKVGDFEKPFKEETDLQEVSKELLKRYTKKASADADKTETSRDHYTSRAKHYALFKQPKSAQNMVDKADEKQNKLTNRLRGMSLADRKSNPDKYKNYPKQFKAKVHAKENFDLLSSITEKEKLTFSDGKSMVVDRELAESILQLHNKLTNDNKQKLHEMVNGTKKQFQTIVEFAMNQ
jgi:hypothetical protein